MKIVNIKTFIVDGGFRPWTFVKLETDTGLVGWGDCTDWGGSCPVEATIKALEPYILGEDPLNTDYIWEKLAARNVRHLTGIAHKAMAGIDIACWDIKGKYYSAPIWQLLGGKFRDTLPLYWTHFGWTRSLFADKVEKQPITGKNGLIALCKEAKKAHFSAVKTNSEVMDILGYHSHSGDLTTQYRTEPERLRGIQELFSIISKELEPDVKIALDVAFSYKLGDAKRLAQAIEQFHPMWLECETFNPDSLREIRHSSSTPICIGESLFGVAQYKPFLDNYAVDIIMPDVAWNGITETKRVAQFAKQYDVVVAPHNCHSPLTSLACAQLCANMPNFYLLEFDYDDVTWRDDIMTRPPVIKNGEMLVPDGPGLGSELIEEELLKHPAKTYTTR